MYNEHLRKHAFSLQNVYAIGSQRCLIGKSMQSAVLHFRLKRIKRQTLFMQSIMSI